MGNFLSKLDKLAKKGSGFGGKLGLISRTVDALIPDANSTDVKAAILGQDTNSGNKSLSTTDTLPVQEAPAKKEDAPKQTLSQKWGHLPMWGKGSIMAVGIALVWMLIKKMTHFGGMKYKRKY